MINLSTNLQLEPITIAKHTRLVTLIKRIYPPAYKHLWKNEDCSFYINTFYTLENLTLELNDKNAEYYFVNYKAKSAGIVRIQYNLPVINKTKTTGLYINRIYLGEEAQGKGVAKQLIHWVEKRAHAKNTKTLWLKAMDTQQQAIKFYTKQGFIIDGKTSLDFELLHKPLRGMHIMTKDL